MSPRANVRSLDAIRYFRPAVIRFEDDVTSALTGLRTELNRTLQWLDHDCPAYWQQQIRSGFDKVAETRTQLSRKQMMTVAGRHPDCIDEKKAHARAKERLEEAQDKLRLCRQWSIKAHRAADEFNARIGRVEQSISQTLPRMQVILEKIILALEAYAAVDRPSRTDADIAPSDSAPVAEVPPANQSDPTGETAADAQPTVDAATPPPAEAASATEAELTESPEPLAAAPAEEAAGAQSLEPEPARSPS